MSFEQQLDRLTAMYKARLGAVAKVAVQDMHQDMQTPIAKGGYMPVDTGFLRNSGAAGLNQAPTGDYSNVELTINQLKIGDTLNFAWVAAYAAPMNNRYGFMDLPLQKWDYYVNSAVKKVDA